MSRSHPHHPPGKPSPRGSLEVITGSMFSGKTEELIRRLRRAELAGLRVRIFKPHLDNRYDAGRVVSHDQNSIPCDTVGSASEIESLLQGELDDIQCVIGIDEAQFLDSGIGATVLRLCRRHTRVIVAGLDMDFLGQPFGPMPELMAMAEQVTKLHAICSRCGEEASHSHRLTGEETQTLLIGQKDHYRPLCRSCFNLFMPPL